MIDFHDPVSGKMKRELPTWNNPADGKRGYWSYEIVDAPPPSPRPSDSDDGMSFMGWVGIVVLVVFLFWAITTKSGGEPGRCVQEDSYMGENVVTCEPYE